MPPLSFIANDYLDTTIHQGEPYINLVGFYIVYDMPCRHYLLEQIAALFTNNDETCPKRGKAISIAHRSKKYDPSQNPII